MEQSTENWLPVPGHPNYEVSDQGRVWSHHVHRTLKLTKKKHGGHLIVGIDGRTTFVHRLVMLAFVGPVPDGMETCHNDGNPENNNLWNLRYDTHYENVQDTVRHGSYIKGHRTAAATRFTADDIRHIRKMYAAGMSYGKIAEAYGIRDRHHIKKIIKKQIWGWVDNETMMERFPELREAGAEKPHFAHDQPRLMPTRPSANRPATRINTGDTGLTWTPDRSSRSTFTSPDD